MFPAEPGPLSSLLVLSTSVYTEAAVVPDDLPPTFMDSGIGPCGSIRGASLLCDFKVLVPAVLTGGLRLQVKKGQTCTQVTCRKQ